MLNYSRFYNNIFLMMLLKYRNM